MAEDKWQPGSLKFVSGVSVFDGSPFVLITWGTMEGQLNAAEAIAHGVEVIKAAQASVYDAAIYAELTETIGLDKEAAAGFIAALRQRLSNG